jgi:hypothetical protein
MRVVDASLAAAASSTGLVSLFMADNPLILQLPQNR